MDSEVLGNKLESVQAGCVDGGSARGGARARSRRPRNGVEKPRPRPRRALHQQTAPTDRTNRPHQPTAPTDRTNR
eukprot:3888540-Prymnesium_polylepis.1